MTLAEIQEQIALDLDSASSAPATTDPEYIRRRKLINRYERAFFARRNNVWSVLLKESSVSTTANQSYVDIPADCVGGTLALSQDGYVKIGDVYYRLVRRDEVGENEYVCYVTGNISEGYNLNIVPTPESVETVYLRYYSSYYATDTSGTDKAVMTEATDITKCPNPYYIVFAVIAEVFKIDDENSKGLDYDRRAEEEMKDALSNENQGSFQQDFSIKTEGQISGYPGLGVN